MKGTLLAFLALMLSQNLSAARCKVDGQWYDYNSPQCSQNRSIETNRIESPQEPPVAPPSTQSLEIEVYGDNFEHMRPWNHVKSAVALRCAGKNAIGYQNSCEVSEEIGYWALRGQYGMPANLSDRAKELCASRSEFFHSQHHCMQGESQGYRMVFGDWELPPDRLAESIKACLERNASFSVRASCMMHEQSRYQREMGIGKSHKRSVPRSTVGYRQALPGYSMNSALAKFDLNPTKTEIRSIGGGPPPAPGPMDIGQLTYRLGIKSTDFSTLDALQSHVDKIVRQHILTVEEPLIQNVAKLSFANASALDPGYGAQFTMGNEGSTVLRFKADSVHIYVVDFVVTPSQEGISYHIAAEGAGHIIEDLGRSYNHLTAQVNVTHPGWVWVSLQSEHGRGYLLHRVVLTSAPKYK